MAPFFTGDVVISVPGLKLGEFSTLPVIEPSEFCFHRDSIGTFFGGAIAAGGGGPLATDFVPPNSENAGFFSAGTFSSGCCFCAGLALEGNKLIVPNDLGAGAGADLAGTGVDFGSAGFPKRLNDGEDFTTGSILGFGMLMVPLRSGIFGICGLLVVWGLDPKKEKAGAAGFSAAGAFAVAGPEELAFGFGGPLNSESVGED